MKRNENYRIIPDSQREDTNHQSVNRTGPRELEIDKTPLFRDLLAGKTIFIPKKEIKKQDEGWLQRIYARFNTAYSRRLHKVWKEYRGNEGVVLWLDPTHKSWFQPPEARAPRSRSVRTNAISGPQTATPRGVQ